MILKFISISLVFLVHLNAAIAANFLGLEDNFTISYDDQDWQVTQKKLEDAQLNQRGIRVILTLENKKAIDRHHARITLIEDTDSSRWKKDLKSPDLIQYRDYAVEFLTQQRFRIESTNPVQIGSDKATSISGVRIEASQRDFGLSYQQVIFERFGKIYLVTLANRLNEKEKFNQVLATFLNSVRFTSPKG